MLLLYLCNDILIYVRVYSGSANIYGIYILSSNDLVNNDARQ